MVPEVGGLKPTAATEDSIAFLQLSSEPGCNIQGLLYIFFFLGGLFVKCTDRFD
jgi:hypothetical protein